MRYPKYRVTSHYSSITEKDILALFRKMTRLGNWEYVTILDNMEEKDAKIEEDKAHNFGKATIIWEEK